MSDVSLRQLELFAALPNFNTLSAAAADLHISESALSQAITNLEKRVGEQLCVRRKARGLTLTPAGQEFARKARQIITDTQELVLGASQGHELRGPVKLGCFAGFATSVIPELLEGFPKLHPEVTIEFMLGTNEELCEALEAGNLDVALTYNVSLPVGFERRKIYPTELEVHLHPEHPLAAQETVDLAELADEPYIELYAAPGIRNVADAFAARGLEPRIEARVSHSSLVSAFVSRGLGYGLLMSRPNTVHISAEGLPFVVKSFDPPVTVSHVVGIWPRDMTLTPRASALLDFAVERLSDYERC